MLRIIETKERGLFRHTKLKKKCAYYKYHATLKVKYIRSKKFGKDFLTLVAVDIFSFPEDLTGKMNLPISPVGLTLIGLFLVVLCRALSLRHVFCADTAIRGDSA